MAELDFSDVLEAPEFTDLFSVVRVTDTVGTNGRSQTAESATNNVTGILYFEAEQTAVGEDASLPNRSLTVITQFRLRDATSGAKPDDVLFDGQRYTITKVVPWTKYGTGWVRATATLKKAVVPAPN